MVLTEMLYARLPVLPEPAVALIVKLEVPAVVGIPEIRPVEPLSVNPAGSAPESTVKVYPPVPPLAVIVWLYAVPIIPLGRLAGLTVSGAVPVATVTLDRLSA